MYDDADYKQALDRVTVGGARKLDDSVFLAEYDPSWPVTYAEEAARVRAALGDRVCLLEHVGSTSVPGLAAKPIIDMVLEVADSGDEADYLPALEAAGYTLRIREPEFREHRLLKGPGVEINLHVFSAGCAETRRMIAFRDGLRADPDDRALYARVKRELAACHWTYLQQYADAKGAVVEEILTRAAAGGPTAGAS